MVKIYADNNNPRKIMNDWQYCKKVQKRHGMKYYIATRFFQKKVRFATYALYAWVRKLDDIVDETKDKAQAKKDFDTWVSDWGKAESVEVSARPEMRAFIKVVKEYNLKQEYLESFIGSMRIDLKKNEYANMRELQEYMYGSATVVGLMMMQILGGFKEEAIPYAKDLAEAMQLTNFLRDIKDDWEKRGRNYMPIEELSEFGLGADDIKNHAISPLFIKFKITQARELFQRAEKGIHMLPKKARFPILLSSRLLEGILNRIEQQDFDVFRKRARINFLGKIIITFKSYLWYRKNM